MGCWLVWISKVAERLTMRDWFRPYLALRTILIHGWRPAPCPICQGLAQSVVGNRGGLAIKNNTDPAQAVKASTVKPKR